MKTIESNTKLFSFNDPDIGHKHLDASIDQFNDWLHSKQQCDKKITCVFYSKHFSLLWFERNLKLMYADISSCDRIVPR